MFDPSSPLRRTILLAGADGAGKSTQAERLQLRLEREGYHVRLCTIWDLLARGAAGGIPFSSKAAIDAFLAALHAPARAMFLHMAMREALDRALAERGDALVLVVAYWPKYNATERLYGAPVALLDGLAASFPRLSLGIELVLAPETALARKHQVSGYESGGAGRTGFLAFQQKVAPVLAALQAQAAADWHRVDAGQGVDAVEQAIAAHVATWLQGAERAC